MQWWNNGSYGCFAPLAYSYASVAVAFFDIAGMKCEQIRKRRVSAGDLDAYIAARFDYSLPGEIVLGDGTTSGPEDVYVNQPLRSGHLYRVFVTAYTSPSVSIQFIFLLHSTSVHRHCYDDLRVFPEHHNR